MFGQRLRQGHWPLFGNGQPIPTQLCAASWCCNHALRAAHAAPDFAHPPALQSAPDAHFKFHAVRALSVALDRIHEALSSAVGTAGQGTDADAAPAAEAGGGDSKSISVEEDIVRMAGTDTSAPGRPEAAAAAAGGAAGLPEGAALPLIGRELRDELKTVLWSAWEVGHLFPGFCYRALPGGLCALGSGGRDELKTVLWSAWSVGHPFQWVILF